MAATLHARHFMAGTAIRGGLRQALPAVLGALLMGGVTAWLSIFSASSLAARAEIIAGGYTMLALVLPMIQAGTIVVGAETHPELFSGRTTALFTALSAALAAVLAGSLLFLLSAMANLGLVDPAGAGPVWQAILAALSWRQPVVLAGVVPLIAVAMARWARLEVHESGAAGHR